MDLSRDQAVDKLIDDANERAKNQGRCEGCNNVLDLNDYTVSGPKFLPMVFSYCEECAAEDKRRGFAVTPV